MSLLLKSLYHTALLGLLAFALGSPMAEGLRPEAVSAHLVAFHNEAAQGFMGQAAAAPSRFSLDFLKAPAERAIDRFLSDAL